nr:hypothetical protein [Planctomicrobium piriforme]
MGLNIPHADQLVKIQSQRLHCWAKKVTRRIDQQPASGVQLLLPKQQQGQFQGPAPRLAADPFADITGPKSTLRLPEAARSL